MTAASGRLIGYARVSTEEQGTDPQLDDLRAAGCATMPMRGRLLRTGLGLHAGFEADGSDFQRA